MKQRCDEALDTRKEKNHRLQQPPFPFERLSFKTKYASETEFYAADSLEYLLISHTVRQMLFINQTILETNLKGWSSSIFLVNRYTADFFTNKTEVSE